VEEDFIFFRWARHSVLRLHPNLTCPFPFLFPTHEEKAIRIEVVVDPARAAAQIAQTQAMKATAAGPAAQKAVAAVRGGGRGRGRGARGGRGGGAPRAKLPKKSLEDLDAEMEDYATKADA
jgi:THO complex subunit 4